MTRRSVLAQSLMFALRDGNFDRCFEIIREQTTSGEVAGATIAVRHHGRVIQQAFGKARTTNAVFLLASLTKPMTATAVMMLVDRGEVSLSDPVQRFIPECR